jgi:hypothetical protein
MSATLLWIPSPIYCRQTSVTSPDCLLTLSPLSPSPYQGEGEDLFLEGLTPSKLPPVFCEASLSIVGDKGGEVDK